MNRELAYGVLYLAAMTVWIYAVVEPSVSYGSDVANVVGASALGAFHVAAGAAIGRGWAPLLALTVPLIAYPAGYAERGELLIWQGYARVAPIAALLLFAGVALRALRLGRRSQPT
jgi:hypothetical protein